MDLRDSTRQEKRQSFFVAIALAAVVMLIGAPVVQAAVQAVRVTNTPSVKVKDSGGSFVNSEVIPPMGLTDVPGSKGAMDVRVYAGGTGVLGVGDCSATGGADNVVTVPGNRVITAFIMTGTGTVTLTSEAVGGGLLPLNRFVTDSGTPNFALSLPNGLGTTAPLVFTGTDGTTCQFTVLGEHLHPGE